jgi:hypothetical protein
MFRVGLLRIGVVVGLILVGAIAGAVFSFAPAYFAIPVALVLLIPLLLGRREGEHSANADEPERNRLGAPRQRFTERDRETLAP